MRRAIRAPAFQLGMEPKVDPNTLPTKAHPNTPSFTVRNPEDLPEEWMARSDPLHRHSFDVFLNGKRLGAFSQPCYAANPDRVLVCELPPGRICLLPSERPWPMAVLKGDVRIEQQQPGYTIKLIIPKP